jgi:hypothetical protein
MLSPFATKKQEFQSKQKATTGADIQIDSTRSTPVGRNSNHLQVGTNVGTYCFVKPPV